VFVIISSSPAKKPLAGSMELGGSLFSSMSWLEFFGPGRVEDEVELVELVVLILDVEVVDVVRDVDVVEVVVVEVVDVVRVVDEV
jgi:hypothetical protein